MSATFMNHVHTIIEDALQAQSVDHRTCFTHLYADAPGGRLVFECSDSGILAIVRKCIERKVSPVGRRGGTSMESPGEPAPLSIVQLPDSAARLPECLVASHSVVDVRREPTHTAELTTQIIYGEAVSPLKEEGDWYLVRLEDRYIGWIRSWHLKPVRRGELERFRSRARQRIRSNVTQIFQAPDDASPPVTDVVVGTPVSVSSCDKRGWRKVQLVDGRVGFLRARVVETTPAFRRVSKEGLAATGIRFLGIPYLWGGTTPKGFDCSGLVQRIFALHGVRIPRDADLQSRFGRLKSTGRCEELNTGDLLFFGKDEERISHVAMFLSDGLFLHAHGQVKVGALNAVHPLFEAKLCQDWRITRDALHANPLPPNR